MKIGYDTTTTPARYDRDRDYFQMCEKDSAGNVEPIQNQYVKYFAMTRIDVINDLIKDNGLRSYLEIGVQGFTCFDAINIKRKIAVDPEARKKRKELISKTSDEYFESCTEKFDLIFIDGLHEHEQVERDIVNSMNHLNKGGFIVLHDCSPAGELHQRVPRESKIWNGDVWRAFVGFRVAYPDIASYCYDEDYGIGVIEYSDKKIEKGFSTYMSFTDFFHNKKELLNIK